MTTHVNRSREGTTAMPPRHDAHERRGRRNGVGALESSIGNTPLIELRAIGRDLPTDVRILGKAEWMNPGGSVKDRAALAMMNDGETRGLLTPERTLIDATSGNTGIAYAMLCAARGYRCRLVVPANANPERIRILKSYGAHLVLTDPMEGGTDEAQRVARSIAEADPDLFFYPDQYNNEANWRAHYRATAPELWEQTGGGVTHLVAGLGTTGTFVGTVRRLKELNPHVHGVAVHPDSPLHGMEGLKHLETARVPGIYDASLADTHAVVATEAAYEMARRLAREEGLFVGVSAAAAVLAALDVAESLEHGVVVAIMPDGGTRYLSERFWEEGKRSEERIEQGRSRSAEGRSSRNEERGKRKQGGGAEGTGLQPAP